MMHHKAALQACSPGSCSWSSVELCRRAHDSNPFCRELERHPDVLLAALPDHPTDFAAMEPVFAPRPRTRKMIGMMSVILAGILLIMLGYLAVGISGYLAFPHTVSSNALNNFAETDVLMQARWLPSLTRTVSLTPARDSKCKPGLFFSYCSSFPSLSIRSIMRQQHACMHECMRVPPCDCALHAVHRMRPLLRPAGHCCFDWTGPCSTPAMS